LFHRILEAEHDDLQETVVCLMTNACATSVTFHIWTLYLLSSTVPIHDILTIFSNRALNYSNENTFCLTDKPGHISRRQRAGPPFGYSSDRQLAYTAALPPKTFILVRVGLYS